MEDNLINKQTSLYWKVQTDTLKKGLAEIDILKKQKYQFSIHDELWFKIGDLAAKQILCDIQKKEEEQQEEKDEQEKKVVR